MLRSTLPAIVCALTLLAVPAFAGDDVIYSGTDVWPIPLKERAAAANGARLQRRARLSWRRITG